MQTCELLGCIYNEDGYCGYNNAPLKFRESRACDYDDIEAELDAMDGYLF